MAASKLLNLIAVSTLAILAASFGATPVSAVSVDTIHIGARSHAHAALAKKRRNNNSKRCKPRPSSSTTKAAQTTKAAETTKAAVPTSKPPATTKAAPTTSKAAPATTTTKASSGGGGGGIKAGLGWAQDDDTALAHFALKGRPIMSWSPYLSPATKKLGFRRCPMLWGPKQISQFTQLVKPGYADVVLGFNEPNQAGQSDLDPNYGAALWKQYIQPLKQHGYTLVSPAPTNAPSGKLWLQNFLKACSECTVDAMAIHIYVTDPQVMIDYLIDMHNTFQRPIWVTEWACQNFGGGAQCSKDQVWKFFQTVKPFMDSQPWITSYFAFGALYDMGNVNPLNQLLGSDGYPTDLGYYYLS